MQETINMNSTFVLALLGLIASGFSIWYTIHLDRRRLIEQENRDVRRKVYLDFYFAIIVLADNQGMDLDDKFYLSYNSLLFYAPDELYKAVEKWHEEAYSNSPSLINAPSLKRVLDLMRKDLGISKKGTISNLNLRLVRSLRNGIKHSQNLHFKTLCS